MIVSASSLRTIFLVTALALAFPTAKAETSSFYDNCTTGAVIALATAACIGGGYIFGTYWGESYYHGTLDKYASPFWILKNSSYDEATLSAELIRFALKEHQRQVAQHWFKDEYDNYPLVTFVDSINTSISWLSFFVFFQSSNCLGVSMRRTIEQLTEIKMAIMGDYKYIKEKRQFDEWRNAKEQQQKINNVIDKLDQRI